MNLEQLRDIVVEATGCETEKVTLEATLSEDLGIDSLASVELVMALEEATGISIEDGEMAKLKTIGDILNYITAHQN